MSRQFYYELSNTVSQLLADVPAEIPAEITVLTMTMHDRALCEEIIRAGIELGAHVRVGIGDNPDAFPDVTNAELVRWAAQEIRKAGLEPATPQDVRQSFRRQNRSSDPLERDVLA